MDMQPQQLSNSIVNKMFAPTSKPLLLSVDHFHVSINGITLHILNVRTALLGW